MGLARGALVALVACSSHATHTVEDARSASRAEPPPSHDAPLAPPAGPYRVDDHPGPAGDATIRVEWPEAPAALRASTGRTPCGTARPPAIAPTTMWGIPDVVVAVLPEHGEAAPQREARIVLDRCALEPRVAVAGATLAITGTAAAPAELAIARRASLRELPALVAGAPRPIQLPIAGHEVDLALEPGAVYELAIAGQPDTAWVVAADTPYVAVTDATGTATLRELPVGRHAVIAWLPPRGGQPGKLARGEVTVTAGAQAEAALRLDAP